MDDVVELWEKPESKQMYMIAGWHQWADAGTISSGLPEYLIDQTAARQIGEIKPGGFYIFQFPGTHHFLRPEISLKEGYRQGMTSNSNDIFFAGNEDLGLVIFLGEEPHVNVERYTDALLDVVEELNVQRVVAVGGVYGMMPYDKEREISCVYSLPEMKDELSNYAVRFSNYEGGSTIGTYLVHKAEYRDIDAVAFYAFVPAYDLSELSVGVQGLQVENDFKAWYDLMHRLDHMFHLELDLSDLEQRSEAVISTMEARIDELDQESPELNIRQFIQELTGNFTETRFMPLGDLWERELGDIFDDLEEE